MPRPAVALVLLTAGAVAAPGAAPPPDPAAVDRLVAQLADPDYARRERAGRDLDALGPTALPALRTAARSDLPEQARRAAALAARIDRRVANAMALAPTVVALKADQTPLAAVLAELSKQSEIPVGLGGLNPAEVGDDPVTLDTGPVPFWEAVRALCTAADLQVRSVGGFPAVPGGSATQYLNGQPVPDTAGVVLEERGRAPRRPAAVFGGVLVETVPIPAAAPADAAVALLLVWPEPKLNWQSTDGARVDRAALAGREFVPFPDPVGPPAVERPVARAFGGRRPLLEEPTPPAPPPSLVPGFVPNGRQAVVRLRPGETPPTRADLAGIVGGVVRTAPEPLVRLDGLKPGAAAEGSHPIGVDLRAAVAQRAGRWELTADVVYDPTEVVPAGTDGGHVRDARTGFARAAFLGLRVADADGGEYDLAAVQFGRPFRADPTRLSIRVVAALTAKPARQPDGDPSVVSFWGSYSRPVEVPFALAGVPLTGGHGK